MWPLWAAATIDAKPESGNSEQIARVGVEITIDLAGVRGELKHAPNVAATGTTVRGVPLAFTDPDGRQVEFEAFESSVFAPELAAKFPSIASYVIRSAAGTENGRVDVSDHGLSAIVRTGRGLWLIDAVIGDPSRARSYWLSDVPSADEVWTCHTHEGEHGEGTHVDDALREALNSRNRGGVRDRGGALAQQRKTVRLAIACTGEYGLHQCAIRGHAPNIDDPIAQIALTVSRANAVFEADMGVHFQLVAGNDAIVYFNPATDPYPDSCDGTGGADCSGPYLSVNIANLASAIGNSNFDVGHLMTRVFGGVAYLSSVCSNNKGGGISGIPRGGDAHGLEFLVVVHELGHQFGATHTFSGTRGRCGNNATLSSAWEAGSGSSPMAYAGGCPVGDAPPSDNIVLFADPYFHHGSIEQMKAFLTGGAACVLTTTTPNRRPEFASITQNQAIPANTPFELSATATDADGDTLEYSWEQFDNGVRRPLSGSGSEDNGMGALFRVFPPRASGLRVFPQMSDVLSAVATPGEQLPSIGGFTRKFRCVVRDYNVAAGSSEISSVVNLVIAPSSTGFSVLSPASGEVRAAGEQVVTWNIGGTSSAPVSCANVTIRLSLDDGATFPTLLGTFPNTGSATLRMHGPSTSARVRVEGTDRAFFSVSRAFDLGACPGDFNADGAVSSQDLFDMLAAWFALSPSADINADSSVSVQDLFDFLALWFAEC